MNITSPVIDVRGISKAFGPRKVLRGLDFCAYDHETVAIMGVNGAGKTTLLNILATLLAADTGQCSYFGIPLKNNEIEIRRRLGLVSHQTFLYSELTSEENLLFFAGLYDLSGREQLAAQMLEFVGLKKQRNQIVRTLSRGMQQRLSIGRALLHDPQILILDEPYTGLDQAMTVRMQALLKQLAESGKTIIMSSHSFQEVSAFATRALFLHKGVIVDSLDLAGMDENQLAQRYRTAVQTGAQN